MMKDGVGDISGSSGELAMERTLTAGGTDQTEASRKYMWLKKFLRARGVPEDQIPGGVDEMRQCALERQLLRLESCHGSTAQLQAAATQPNHLSDRFSYPHRHRRMPYASEQLEMSPEEVERIEQLTEQAAASQPSDRIQRALDGMARPIRLIVDTDVGSDFDDVLALLTLFNLPEHEVQLIGVTTNYQPTKLRKAVAESMLAKAGQRFSRVPVVAGSDLVCGSHRELLLFGNEGLGLEQQPGWWAASDSDEAVEFIYQAALAAPGQVVVCAIGMCTNLGMCHYLHPDFEQLVGHVFWMGGGGVCTQRHWQGQQPPPFRLPAYPHEGVRWMRGLELADDQISRGPTRPVTLLPNHNASGDTLATCLMFQMSCPISVISHRITKAHFLRGKAIDSLLEAGRMHEAGQTSAGPAAFQQAGRYLVEWFKTRAMKAGQCTHDPLTLYEAIYPSLPPVNQPASEDDEPCFVPGKASLRYCCGTFVAHEWAGFLTFVPDPSGPHRIAIDALNPRQWLEWLENTIMTGVAGLSTLSPFREIRAVHDETTVRVYQAYNDAIADAAVAANSFQGALELGVWSVSRMSWVKPSAVWMAYRCGWTTLKDKNQRRVLALDLSRPRFEELLMGARLSHGGSAAKCKQGFVTVQWDPERVICSGAESKQVFTRGLNNVRSIQVGMRGGAWLLDPANVLRITDVTDQFRGAVSALEAGDEAAAARALWPKEQERPMEVPEALRAVLDMDAIAHDKC